jgi:hypothetical protein
MDLRKRAMTAVACAAAISAGAFSMTGSASAQAPAAAAAPFCQQSGPIAADQIKAPVPTASCPIAGRLITLPGGAGLHVPAPGGRTVVQVLTTSGEESFDVSNLNGQVHVTSTLPGSAPRASAHRAARASTAADPACSDSHYLVLDPFVGNLNWYYNSSSASRAHLSGSTTLTAIRTANSNDSLDHNDCGLTGQFAVYGSYQGDTSKYANINSSGQCTSNFPDGQNTDSWGPYNGNGDLAVTCTYHVAGRTQEADTNFGSDVGFVASLGGTCTNSYDLQDVATHEWGHSFGLNDLYSASDSALTMYGYSGTCETSKDTIGLGDYDGFANLYGFR